MILHDLQVDGFGVWTDLRVADVSPRLTVFFGRNEAGKTTLLQFVRAVLFGFTPDRRARYLPPVEGGTPGGRLVISCGDGRFALTRRDTTAQPLETDLGRLTVTTADGAEVSDGRWRQLLGDVDESIFRNVYAVGLDELQELATLSDSAAGELLYKLTTGVDRVALSDVIRELNSSRRRLLSDGDTTGHIQELIARRDGLREEVDRLAAGTDGYVRVLGQRADVERTVKDLETRRHELDRKLKIVETAIAVREPWYKRAALDEELHQLGDVSPVPEGTPQRVAELNELLEKRRRKLRRMRRTAGQLAQEQRALGFRPDLWRFGPRIEALIEQREWIEKLDQQNAIAGKEIATLTGESQIEQQRLLDNSKKLEVVPDQLTRGALAQLRPLVRVLNEERNRLTSAEEDAARAQRQLDQVHVELQGALKEFPDADLTLAMDKSGQHVSALRRRVQLEERLDRLKRQLQDLAHDSDDLADNHLLSGWALGGLGVLFVLGVAMILAGLFFGPSVTGRMGIGLTFLGILGAAAAVIIKRVVEQSAAEQLEACEKQMDVLRLQYKQAKDERDHLDAAIPNAGGPLTVRLQSAEKLHTRLEELLPVQTRRQLALGEVTAATQRLEQARRDHQAAQDRWQRTLEAAGLPHDLAPAQVQTLAQSRVRVTDLDRRRDQLSEDQLSRRRAMESLQQRIEQLLADLGLAPESADPLARLAQLQREHQNQHTAVRRRNELRRQRRELRRDYDKLRGRGRLIVRRRLQTLRGAGCETEDELQARLARIERARQLAEQRSEQHRLVMAGLGEPGREPQIAAELASVAHARELDSRWEQLSGEVQTLEDRRRELYQQQGRLEEQLKHLLEDHRLAAAQLELGTVECQVQEALAQWQTLATTSRILHAIRADYERQRQPETLLTASKYFARLTGGAYTRVWTPLDEDNLRVDDAKGHTLAVDVLSRGTREQLFLSLRLALVESYARRGTVMPLVLDDLFVNFDTVRTQAAAEVLFEFAAAGHQVLVFTCHEHIVKIFRAMDADVRALRGELEPEEPPVLMVPLVELAAPPVPAIIAPAPPELRPLPLWKYRSDVIINESGEGFDDEPLRRPAHVPLTDVLDEYPNVDELEPAHYIPKRPLRRAVPVRRTPVRKPHPVRVPEPPRPSGPWDEEAPLWFAGNSSVEHYEKHFPLVGVASVGTPVVPWLWSVRNVPAPTPRPEPVRPVALRHDSPLERTPRWHFWVSTNEGTNGAAEQRVWRSSVLTTQVGEPERRKPAGLWNNGASPVDDDFDEDSMRHKFA